MKKFFVLLGVTLLSILVTGCASITDDDTQQVFQTQQTRRKVVTTTSETKTTTTVAGDQDFDGYTTTSTTPISINEDDLNRVSVSKVTTTTEPPITTTTTTTTTKNVFETLLKPNADEYLTSIESYTVSNKSTDLNLRYGPSTDYKSQITLKAKDDLECLAKRDDWYYVTYNSTFGWVNKESLTN